MRSAHQNHLLNRFQYFEIFLYAIVSTKHAFSRREALLEIYHSGPFHVGEVSAYHLLARALQGWFKLVRMSLYTGKDRGMLKLLGNLMLV